MTTASARRRSWAPNLLLAAISLAVGLLLAEGALRAYFWSRGVGRDDVEALLIRSRQADVEEIAAEGVYGLVQPSPYPDIVYEIKPNLRGTFRGKALSTNSWGMRGPEVPRRKPAGTYRIVGLGDSHMFGWGVAQDETYLALLKRRLNDTSRDRRFEVLNFGAPGYNTTMEVATLEHRALTFGPDLILVHFIGNDFGMPHLLQPPRGADPRDWYLGDLLRAAFGAPAGGELQLLPHDIRHLPDEEQRRTRKEYRHMLGEAGYRRAIERLARLTSDPPIPVVVMMLGDAGEQRQLVRRIVEEAGLSVLNPMSSFSRQVRRIHGVDRVDLPTFRRTFEIPDDGHPSPAAHQAYAEALFEDVRRRLAAGGSE